MPIQLQELEKNHNSYVYSDLFQGIVVSADPGTHIIQISPEGQTNSLRLQGIHLSSVFSAALGFADTILPTVGTRVLCCGRAENRTLIIGTIPYPENQANISSPTLPNKAILGTIEPLFRPVHKNGYLDSTTKAIIHNNNLPTDTLPGEKVISNEFGVMLGLFKLMASLKASELSQVQCHFLDDLVRIISHNFQHYTSLGELKVFQDGKGIHLEMGATHKPNESLGKSTSDNGGDASDDISTSNTVGITQINSTQNYNQFYDLSDDQLVMLERMKLFVGQLGQFVNFLIINPSQEQHALNGTPPNTPDTGLLQLKASLDGTLVVRSVKGIFLEKTNWIRVPHRIRTPEDPSGDDGTTITYPEQPDYTFDDTYTYRGEAFLYYLQLRDYLSYINEGLGYTNFNAHTQDFYVNNDKTNETPLEQITYIDQETGIAYTQTKSWISLMGNGGISLADAWGSCISMEGGNIYIQPAKDLIVQPNRNLIAKVGGNVSIASQYQLDLSSTNGGLRVKTEEAQYLYSASGGIILHTDAENIDNTTQVYSDDKPMVLATSGIVMLAPESGVNTYASQIYNNATSTFVAQGPQVTLSSSEITRLRSDSLVELYGDYITMMSKLETINYSAGSMTIMGLTETIVGLKNQNFGVVSFLGGDIPVTGYLDPNNNADQSFFTDLSSQLNDLDTFDITTILDSFTDDTDFTDISFQFPPTDIYSIDQSVDVIPQTLSQQTDVLSGIYGFEPWEETPINNSYPYPGSDFTQSLVTVEVNNSNVESDIVLANKAVGLVSQSTTKLSNIFDTYQAF